ncbi:MFS general substrate transporter [Armillaria borealis]|uniref:MFS general substrate transporter n=1 Tax=Armillaria borealis TaxID=47425 RepID=A0AA39J2X2_9AGAR|nr:MFS general substrate transporter [Armillaria borealis]
MHDSAPQRTSEGTMSLENADTVYTYKLLDSSQYSNNCPIVLTMLTTHSRRSGSPVSKEGTTLDDVPLATASAEYTPQQYKKLKRKVDYYLLPLLWLCYGLQDADRAVLSPMSVFRLREDTGLVALENGQDVMCMGIVMLCIGFGLAKDFTQLVALRFLLGIFQCCIGSGFILIIGCWYTRNEHSSRSLVFLSSGVGVGSIIDLILYGIGTLEYRSKDIQAWRYMAYVSHIHFAKIYRLTYLVLSSSAHVTIFVGIVCFHFLGSPSEVSWLTKEEKRMANVRILENQSGHDRTGISAWKWYQARECLTDPCFYFTAIVVFLTARLFKEFYFTFLKIWHPWSYIFLLDLYVAFLSVEHNESNGPETSYRLRKLRSGQNGRLVRLHIISSYLNDFPSYCAGSMCGSQIFRQKDAPTYKPGLIGCGVCFAIELLVIIAWRATLVLRNRRRVKATVTDGLTQEEKLMQGKINGESDMTDFENPHRHSVLIGRGSSGILFKDLHVSLLVQNILFHEHFHVTAPLS